MAFEAETQATEIDPAANDIGRQPGANAPAPAAGEPAGQAAAPADPWTGEAPAFVAEKFGVKTFGELQEKFDTQAREAALAEAYRELYANSQQAPAAPVPAAPNAQQGGKFFGFETAEQYLAAYRADPVGTERRKMAWMLQGQGQEMLKPFLDQHLQPLQQNLFQSRAKAAAAEVAQRYPEAQKAELFSGPAWAKFNQTNGEWLQELGKARPDLNVHELAYKLHHYDQLYAEAKALRAKHGELQKAGGTARANVGAAAVTQGRPKTHKEAYLLAAEKLRAAGQSVPQEWIDGGMNSIQR